MKDRDEAYWRGRFEQLENAAHKDAEETMMDVDAAYRAASREIESQISVWYQRFADNNGIVSMAEARQRLNAGELKEFKWTVEEYIKHGRENGVSADWSKQLENASCRFHITRLEALKVQIQNTVEVLYGNQLDALDALTKQTVLSSYLHSAFEVQKGLGVGWDIAGLNEKGLVSLITRPWSVDGKNFSTRIWESKTRLINEVSNLMTRNLLTGGDLRTVVKELASRMNVAEWQAARLVYTENAYFQSLGQYESMKALGVKKYEFVATLDDRTSDTCREMDGKVYDLKDFQPGITAPPMHPWCRSATAPHYDDLKDVGERAARDPDTGKTYYVPNSMKYNEWKQAFVDGEGKDNLTPVPVRNYTSAIATVLGKTHYDAMRDIMDKCGSADMRDVWDKYEQDVGVADIHETKRAHCDWKAAIHVDAQEAPTGTYYSKPYQTVFHEAGHAIDMIAGHNAAGAGYCHPTNLFSATYKNGLFPKTIKDEINTLVSTRDAQMKAEFKAHATDYDWLIKHGYVSQWQYEYFTRSGRWLGGVPKYSKSMAYKAIEEEIRALTPFAKADLSDIMEGATREKIQVGWGHGNGYWKNGDWTLATEAFAEMVDSTVANSESLDAIRKYLPQSYGVFEDMLKDMK